MYTPQNVMQEKSVSRSVDDDLKEEIPPDVSVAATESSVPATEMDVDVETRLYSDDGSDIGEAQDVDMSVAPPDLRSAQ